MFSPLLPSVQLLHYSPNGAGIVLVPTKAIPISMVVVQLLLALVRPPSARRTGRQTRYQCVETSSSTSFAPWPPLDSVGCSETVEAHQRRSLLRWYEAGLQGDRELVLSGRTCSSSSSLNVRQR